MAALTFAATLVAVAATAHHSDAEAMSVDRSRYIRDVASCATASNGTRTSKIGRHTGPTPTAVLA